jgi:ABC-type branched-subunit amino acid transport system ATPase component/predicted MFS family arabinose efflux permease
VVSPAPAETHALEAGALAASVLAEEELRQEAQLSREGQQRVLNPEVVAGLTGGEQMPWRAVVRNAGPGLMTVLTATVFLDAIDGVAFGVVTPDIRRELGLSLTEVGVVGALGGIVVFLAAIPLGSLGDRYRRLPIIGFCTLLAGAFIALTGAVQSIWQLVVCRMVVGIGKANEIPVQGAVLADAVPIQGRNRAYGLVRGSQTLGFLIGPAVMGLVAELAGWRSLFPIVAAPTLLIGAAAFFLREPRRGRQEMIALLGEELPVDDAPVPVPLRTGFARLRKVQTVRFFVLALGVLGLTLIAVPIYMGIFLQDRYDLSAGGRGLVGSFAGIGGTVGVVLGGVLGDRLFRRSPSTPLKAAGAMIAASGILQAAALFMPNVVLFTIASALAGAGTFGAFVTVQGTAAAVFPYRLRSTGGAMISLYLSLFGGLLGAILIGQLSSSFSLRNSLVMVTLVAAAGGAGLLAYGSRFVAGDMNAAGLDLLEERDDMLRAAAGNDIPLLHVRHLDFSYGPVQVLFDVNIDVWEGEVLALLGTNGAGKSTVLRAISGLNPGDRGVVRFAGRTLTFAEPRVRLEHGIVQVPGGKATFPTLTVAENLRARGYTVRNRDLDARIARVLGLFPVLAARLDQPAGSLSGGEQQMLAIAGALMLDPKILLIDELSLGLAPVMVQQLLEVIARLKAEGMTMVIVEQSVNVALSVADRAVFMEKGQVRFQGPAAELLERDDLIRAVFLGAEGG